MLGKGTPGARGRGPHLHLRPRQPRRHRLWVLRGSLFDKKLAELSGARCGSGTSRTPPSGGTAEGGEKVRQGDIDFALNSTANTAMAAPYWVFSLHFIFWDEAHLAKAVNDPTINATFKKTITEHVTGAFLRQERFSLGFRNMYAKFPIAGIADVTGKKVRVRGDEDRGRLLQPSLPSDPGAHAVRPGVHLAPNWAGADRRGTG